MEKKWSYGDFEIKEGPKPGSKHFQYFFVVSGRGEKKCNYCVWIEDDALSRFDPSKEFDSIISSHREEWSKWVKAKIDDKDFRNLALKFEKDGQTELELSAVEEKLTMD
jgi:hypothetical protein